MSRLVTFTENVLRSGLVSAEALERAREGMSAGGDDAQAPVRLARLLVQSGALTSYQARKLLVGATRGFLLGGYRILRRLGEGGMGKVYLAQSEAGGEPVAIKVLPPQRAAEGQAINRFRREMDLSQRVTHPNLARTLDVGVEGDVYFMVLEYIRGRSLYQMVKDADGGPLRVPDAARFFIKVLAGLEAAHGAGLIHRDIKPSNLMVTPESDAKVLDLGLARLLGEEGALTRPNIVIGTLDYASPEQLGDAARADQRSDLYSVGCTLYFTLAGHPPFEGGDVVNKIFKQRMEDPEPLERVSRGVPSSFAAIVRKLMNKTPADRYQSAAELSTDLVKWTDPAIVHDILGVAAETARAFRPPPPDLDDEDLRWIIAESESPRPGSPRTAATPGPRSLRDLGDSEPSLAPRHKSPTPPRAALVVPADYFDHPSETADPRRDRRKLAHFLAVGLIVAMLGVALVVLLASFR